MNCEILGPMWYEGDQISSVTLGVHSLLRLNSRVLQHQLRRCLLLVRELKHKDHRQNCRDPIHQIDGKQHIRMGEEVAGVIKVAKEIKKKHAANDSFENPKAPPESEQ